MYTFLIILIILDCILLTMVILAQASKGDGLAGGLGAPGSVGAVFGVRRASDFLTKMTIGLATALGVLVLVTNLFFLPGTGSTTNAVQQASQPVPTTQAPAQSAPAVQMPVNPNPPAGAQPGTGQTSPDQNPPTAAPVGR